MKPEILMIESDHDMRNPADFLVLDKLAKGIFRVPGISRVQAITRPDGTAMDHTTIPFQISMQNAGQVQTMKYQRDRMNDMLTQADEMAKTMATMRRMYGLMTQLAEHHAPDGRRHRWRCSKSPMNCATTSLISMTSGARSAATSTGRSTVSTSRSAGRCGRFSMGWTVWTRSTRRLNILVGDIKNLDRLMPEMIAHFPPMIETMESMRTMMLTMHSTMSGILDQMDEMSENANAMGKAFDAAKNDDSFYLPPEVFKNKDFQRAMKYFPVAGRARGALHHSASGRSRVGRGHREHPTRYAPRPRSRSREHRWRTQRSTWPE